ncbi:hypothetical protein [Pseudomonas sp. GD03746]|uniref:hypothetical protein n=1 Tax=Pseudomonas sp. GD03746 TaxID=2975378 RepID=UPI00244B8351|nr:hypothetical protein [Pseudomonas sp. GD03746]MDH1575535.1 hypothetical protein [Pseudomonas sp. GD03746]
MTANTDAYRARYKAISYFVDRKGYREKYSLEEGVDPVDHYLEHGSTGGFDPSEFFSSSFYLERYPDVARAGMNPLLHYVRFGTEEERSVLPPEAIQDKCPNFNAGLAELRSAKWEPPCIIYDDQLSTDKAEMLDIMVALNSTPASAVIVKRDSADWLVVFSGRTENFFLVRKMLSFWGNILFLRDKVEKYYCDNSRLPVLDRLGSYIEFLTGPRKGRTVLMGQSYGGYTSLYQSMHIKDALTFSFSPQVFHPKKHPHGMYFEEGIKKVMPENIAPDVLSHLKQACDAPRYVIAGISECSHDSTYYWGDAIGAGLAASTGKAVSLIVNRSEHSTIKYLNAPRFFGVLKSNFDLLTSSMHNGANLLAKSQIYYQIGTIPKDDQM